MDRNSLGDRGVEKDFLLVQNRGGEEVDVHREGFETGRVHAARRSRKKRMERETDALRKIFTLLRFKLHLFQL